MGPYQGDLHGCRQYPDGKTSGPPQRHLGHKAAKIWLLNHLLPPEQASFSRHFKDLGS